MNLTRYKVSLIIPIYNVEEYLSQCLDSVIHQTHNNLEIILIDDGSADNSGEIADLYGKKDKRISVIHGANNGVSSARNIGLSVATGDFICFADSDDILMSDYVEYLLYLLIQYNAEISLTTNVYTSNFENDKIKERITIINGEKATSEILLHKLPIGVYSKMFSKSLIAGRFFLPELFIGEGFYFNTAIFQDANRVVMSNKRIYLYRTNNPASAVNYFSIKKWENALYSLDMIEKNLKIKTPLIYRSMKYAKWFDYGYILRLLVLIGVNKKYPEMMQRCINGLRALTSYVFIVDVKFRFKMKAVLFFFIPTFLPRCLAIQAKMNKISKGIKTI